MRSHFLFPSHPTRPRVVDEVFAEQHAAMGAAGFSVSVFSETALRDGKPLRDIPRDATVAYRGWMLNVADYTMLAGAISDAGAVPLTSAAAYVAAHHLPSWYPLIAEFTPETRMFDPDAPTLESALRELGWDAFFIKDYVKSLKTARGSILRDPSEIANVIADMKHFRGDIEGGVCVRRVEAFIAESEQRCFVLDGRVYTADASTAPNIVEVVASRIPSRFFSIDAILRDDGVLRIVEIGDGQVSDLVGWSIDAFVTMWLDHAGRGPTNA